MLNLSEFSQGRCLNVLLIHAMRGLEIQRNKHREIRKQGRTNVQHKTSTWWVTEWVLLPPRNNSFPHSAFIGVTPGMNHQNYIVLPLLFFFPQVYDLQSNDIFTKEVKCVAFLESMCCLIDLKYYVCTYACMYVSIYLVVLVLFHFCKQRIWVVLAVWVCGHNIWYIILLMIDEISY